MVPFLPTLFVENYQFSNIITGFGLATLMGLSTPGINSRETIG